MLFPMPISRRSWLSTFLGAVLWAVVACLPARAININGEGPTNVTGIYDRFNVGTYPGTPVRNPSFIGSSLDLSGIGWSAADPNQSITLVSSQYFVGASHFRPGIGTSLRFFGTDNSLYSAMVHSYHTLTYTGTDGPQASDLTLGRLSIALAPAVTPMPIFYPGATNISNPSSFNQYSGVTLLNYGHTARMGVNTIDSFTEFRFTQNPPNTNIGFVYTRGAGAGETLLESGDSGSPTIAYRNGVYGLIGTHSGVHVPSLLSVDAFVGYTPFITQMNSFMAADGQSLILAVPEPGTVFFGIALLGLCGAHRVRRARRES